MARRPLLLGLSHTMDLERPKTLPEELISAGTLANDKDFDSKMVHTSMSLRKTVRSNSQVLCICTDTAIIIFVQYLLRTVR